MITTNRSLSPTARKVVGSLAVLGTAAAVAGLGTYGNFTDSTTPMNTTVASGTLSIDLTPAGAYGIPVSVDRHGPRRLDHPRGEPGQRRHARPLLGQRRVVRDGPEPADHGQDQRPAAVGQDPAP